MSFNNPCDVTDDVIPGHVKIVHVMCYQCVYASFSVWIGVNDWNDEKDPK